MHEENLECGVLVVGAGPGGAITACLLAEAGIDVLLVEEGSHLLITSSKSYSLEEMNQKYRNSGITPALGKTMISYVEACCVGGGSEINAGLYHRLPPEIIKDWQLKYQIKDFEEKKLEPFFEACEEELSVSTIPGEASQASNKLKEGANKLNWKVDEIPRWFKYTKNSDGTWKENRQSMTETYIPKAIEFGCRLLPNTKIIKLVINESIGLYAEADSVNREGLSIKLKIHFQHIFVCGGAIQTPALLRRSGIKNNIGNSLCMHPMLKVIALFDEKVNSETMGIPVHQVKEFSPHLTLGCSVSTQAYLALGLNHLNKVNDLLTSWRKMAIYYVSTTGIGRGSIRTLPFSNAPLVRFSVTNQDLCLLKEGLDRLCLLLFKADAVELFPSVQSYSSFRDIKDLAKYRSLPHKKTNITTVHIFSSCPMGEDIRQCAVNSYGKLHGYNNIYLNDGSILSGPPSVSPQGTIMALARRNTLQFLESKC